jgi:hypothetical protein
MGQILNVIMILIVQVNSTPATALSNAPEPRVGAWTSRRRKAPTQCVCDTVDSPTMRQHMRETVSSRLFHRKPSASKSVTTNTRTPQEGEICMTAMLGSSTAE